MASAFFEEWKDASWPVLVAALLINCFLGLSSSQEDSPHSQPAIEQALLDALPTTEELPNGINWDQPNYRPEFFDIDWTGQRNVLECPYGMKDTITERDNSYISAGLNFISSIGYNSPEEFRSKRSSIYSRGTVAPYPDLPGGLIWEDKDGQEFEFEILFWKSPSIDGSVRFNVVLGSDCGPPTPDRQAKAEALARSECEWLAHLVWSRLPAWGVCPQPPILLSGFLQGKQTELDLQPRDPGILSRGLCRGACGSDCPQTCLQKPDIVINVPDETGNNYYTCTYPGVVECGSHLACVKHDACFDRCVSDEHETDTGGKCHTKCNLDIYNEYGMSAYNWINGRGPFDHNLTYSYPAVQTGPFPGKPTTSLTPITNPRIDQHNQ